MKFRYKNNESCAPLCCLVLITNNFEGKNKFNPFCGSGAPRHPPSFKSTTKYGYFIAEFNAVSVIHFSILIIGFPKQLNYVTCLPLSTLT